MKLKLVRIFGDAYTTNGKLYIHGIPFCETMESPKHGDKSNRCIEPGEYKLMMIVNRFSSFCPKLIKTKGRKDIIFRPGGNCTEACGSILVGEVSTCENHTLVGSKTIFKRLIEMIKDAYLYGDRKCTLTIEEAPEFEYVANAERYTPRKEDEYGYCD